MCTADQRKGLEAALFNPMITEPALGGARGTAKTFFGCLCTLLYLLKCPGEDALCIRITQSSARDGMVDQFMDIARMLRISMEWNEGRKEFRLFNGSEIHIRYCSSDNDYQKYQGLPYAVVWFDEATQHQKMNYQLVGGSSRTKKPGYKKLKIVTANPGGIGDVWVKERFVDKRTAPKFTLWIPSNLFESLPTMERNPDYYDRELKDLPEWKQRQWVFGDWDVIAGAYFNINDACIRDVDVPPHAKWYCGVDWGYSPDPFAVVWFARWRDDQDREHVHVGLEYQGWKMTPDIQARNALKREDDGWKSEIIRSPVRIRFADPSVWKRQETESTEQGRTIATMWAKHNFVCKPAKTNARVPGWQLLRMVLDNGLLTISPRCVGLIEEMRYAVQEGADRGQITSEDVDPKCDDHLLDSLRYGLVSTLGLNYTSEEIDDWHSVAEERRNGLREFQRRQKKNKRAQDRSFQIA